MIMNNIGIVQSNNEYHFYTENNIYLGGVILPANGQYMFDTKVLNIIPRALAIRWHLVPTPKNI